MSCGFFHNSDLGQSLNIMISDKYFFLTTHALDMKFNDRIESSFYRRTEYFFSLNLEFGF
jgi:hypothetical protein